MGEQALYAEAPFSYMSTKTGLVQISCRGRLAKTLRGKAAARFLLRVESASADAAQLLMAKETGQFKLGNERQAEAKAEHR